MRRWARRIVTLVWAGAMLAVAAPVPAAGAQAAVPTVTLAPPSLSLPSDGEVPAAIVATNPTGQPVRVSFGDVHAPGVVVNVASRPDEPRSPALPARVVGPGSSLRWDLRLRRAAGGDLPSTFVVAVRVRGLDDGGTEIGPVLESLLVASLAGAAPEGIDKVVAVEVKASVDRVDDVRKGDIHLVVRNVSAGPVTVTATARKHDHVAFEPPDAPSVVVQGGHEAVLTYRVQGHRRVQPGPTTLVFEVALRWGNLGQERTGTVVATHSLDLGVFGDSEFADILTVPLLLLPGVLALAAVAVCWRLGVRLSRSNDAAFPLNFKSAEYWLFALGLAACWLGIYAWWTGASWATALSIYGSADVARLVLLATVGTVLLYGLLCGVRWLVRRRGIPAAGDSPIQLLDRRKKGGVWVEVATEKDGTEQWFVLGENWRRTKLVVAPAVLVSFLRTDAATQEIEEQVLAQLERDGSAAALVRILREGQGAGQVRLTWRPQHGRVVEVDATRVNRGIGRDAPMVVV